MSRHVDSDAGRLPLRRPHRDPLEILVASDILIVHLRAHDRERSNREGRPKREGRLENCLVSALIDYRHELARVGRPRAHLLSPRDEVTANATLARPASIYTVTEREVHG